MALELASVVAASAASVLVSVAPLPVASSVVAASEPDVMTWAAASSVEASVVSDRLPMTSLSETVAEAARVAASVISARLAVTLVSVTVPEAASVASVVAATAATHSTSASAEAVPGSVVWASVAAVACPRPIAQTSSARSRLAIGNRQDAGVWLQEGCL